MKTALLISLSSLVLFTSCSKKNSTPPSTYKDKVVLEEFQDDVSIPSLNFEAIKDLPKVIDLRSDMTSVKNQGSRGTCTFFSTVALLEATIKKDLQKDVNLSEEFMSYSTKARGSYYYTEGSEVSSNLRAVSAAGLLLERDWSYQPSWFGPKLPCEAYKATEYTTPRECFTHNAPDAETSKRIIPGKGLVFKYIDKDMTEIIKFIAEEKRPLTLSVPVNFNGWPDSGDVFHNEDLRQECLDKPSDCAGHSILITGYDINKKVFFFKNSWGNAWGKEGYGTITFSTVDNYVTDSLYFATASAEFEVPEDHEKDYLELIDFNLMAIQNDGSNLKLATTGSINNLRGKTIYVSSFLSQKHIGVTAPASDTNASSIALEAADGIPNETYARGFLYFLPKENSALTWTPEVPLMIDFPQNILKTPSVKSVLDSTDFETLARTTIYVHTDDASFKVLKRIYHPIK